MLLNWTEFVLYVGVLNENSANKQGENCMAGHTTSHVNSFFGQKLTDGQSVNCVKIKIKI